MILKKEFEETEASTTIADISKIMKVSQPVNPLAVRDLRSQDC